MQMMRAILVAATRTSESPTPSLTAEHNGHRKTEFGILARGCALLLRLGEPGNANLPIGGWQIANREIGVPGHASSEMSCTTNWIKIW